MTVTAPTGILDRLDQLPLARCGDDAKPVRCTCDDGNEVETDACRTEPAACCGDGVRCTRTKRPATMGTTSHRRLPWSCAMARCGDGVVQQGVEALR